MKRLFEGVANGCRWRSQMVSAPHQNTATPGRSGVIPQLALHGGVGRYGVQHFQPFAWDTGPGLESVVAKCTATSSVNVSSSVVVGQIFAILLDGSVIRRIHHSRLQPHQSARNR